MRNSTSRALRATATVAGVAALGASFVGTASADSGLGGLGGSDSSSSNSNGGLGNFNGLGGGENKSVLDEPGLANFEMPGMGMGSRGLRTSNPWDDFGDNDNGDEGDFRDFGRHGNDCDSDGDDHGYRDDHAKFQMPIECRHNHVFKNDTFNFFGHNFRTSYQPKSIGARSMRTDSPFDGFGGNDFSGGNYGGGSSDGFGDFGSSNLYNHQSHGTSSRTYGDDDGNGASGHHIKLPIDI